MSVVVVAGAGVALLGGLVVAGWVSFARAVGRIEQNNPILESGFDSTTGPATEHRVIDLDARPSIPTARISVP